MINETSSFLVYGNRYSEVPVPWIIEREIENASITLRMIKIAIQDIQLIAQNISPTSQVMMDGILCVYM